MSEAFRPCFHYTPARNWMNDPNGLVWFAGEWHLFYQYNPLGDQWGHMSWGHAVSVDLVSWEELPVAIPEDARHWIFSGSVVVDWANSSGLGDGVAPPLVALYTGAERGAGAVQSQCLAYSHDRGRSWSKYAGNPVLDRGLADFRDPKVFWHAPTARWIMVVVLSMANRVAFYASANLRDWDLLSEFGPAGPAGTVWECPDLFELPVEGCGATRWLLKFDLMRSAEPGNCVAVTLVGDFDGTTFHPDRDAAGTPIWQRADHGHDFYAAISWSDVPAADGRRIWIGWMNNHHYTAATPTAPWRGAMTLPRTLALRRTAAGDRLIQHPVREFHARRGAVVTRRNVKLAAAQNLPLMAATPRPLAFEWQAQFENAAALALHITAANGDQLAISWCPATRALAIHRSAGAMATNPAFAAPCTATLDTDLAALHVFLDRSSIEVFANNGATVLTAQHFMADTNWSATLCAGAGASAIAESNLWCLAA